MNRGASGKRVLITAGPTREMLDPVRFISNLSTGEMGYAIAQAAQQLGYRVTLISGPTCKTPPDNIKVIQVMTAAEMKRECQREFRRHDILVMSAAVCDFVPARKHFKKLRRRATRKIDLKPTPDIVSELAQKKGRRLVIGFSLETTHWLKNASKKLREKKLDGIAANYYRRNASPFGAKRVTTALLSRGGETVLLKNQSKKRIAWRLLKWIEGL